ALHERQARGGGRLAQVGQHGADRGLLVVERLPGVAHLSTAISSATLASHSSFDVPAGSASGAPPASRPVPDRLRKYVVSANSRSAATRLGRYGCDRVNSSSRPTPRLASSSCARYSSTLTSLYSLREPSASLTRQLIDTFRSRVQIRPARSQVISARRAQPLSASTAGLTLQRRNMLA